MGVANIMKRGKEKSDGLRGGGGKRDVDEGPPVYTARLLPLNSWLLLRIHMKPQNMLFYK